MWIVLVIFSWLVFFDTVAYGQTGGCSIKLDQAPSLRGIKLGMSLNQVLDLIPGSREDKNVTESLDTARRGHPNRIVRENKPHFLGFYLSVTADV